ncbi:deoxyribose-phosphate aldolase [Thermanaeromonas toyohensis ToBE]|uniref:Deoxyribose-phosphate aldolase n=1 Tax=Thermanaeromonas toyohensis ToBE TaxID=698762 RepID=A0A1W1VZD5_9FIRM|nr:deoxyribose-phosphate aldolase [Thermanaeromonas toyohensis]SMB98742.1 deoxyribose-phosphate aldolase [Thermanaeromonas toyohensis ToBE]
MWNKRKIAAVIDHTLLKPVATQRDIERLCNEALECGFFSVCLNPCYVPWAAKLLEGSGIRVCTVVGFPLGATTIRNKVLEASEAIDNGAAEIDMVINLSLFKSGAEDYIRRELKEIIQTAKTKNKDTVVKVIIETCLLEEQEKLILTRLALEEGADFIKTSTGFNGPGATVEDVRLIRQVVGDKAGVKASGGIRTYSDAVKMLEAGANRLGTSSGLSIYQEAPE